jgi:hypothetical protein
MAGDAYRYPLASGPGAMRVSALGTGGRRLGGGDHDVQRLKGEYMMASCGLGLFVGGRCLFLLFDWLDVSPGCTARRAVYSYRPRISWAREDETRRDETKTLSRCCGWDRDLDLDLEASARACLETFLP